MWEIFWKTNKRIGGFEQNRIVHTYIIAIIIIITQRK